MNSEGSVTESLFYKIEQFNFGVVSFLGARKKKYCDSRINIETIAILMYRANNMPTSLCLVKMTDLSDQERVGALFSLGNGGQCYYVFTSIHMYMHL